MPNNLVPRRDAEEQLREMNTGLQNVRTQLLIVKLLQKQKQAINLILNNERISDIKEQIKLDMLRIIQDYADLKPE